MRWIWRLLCSITLAVVLILVIAAVSLVGVFLAPANFFRVWWFVGPGALLMLNILFCSINRWKSIEAVLRGGQIRRPDSFFAEQESEAETFDSPASTTE